LTRDPTAFATVDEEQGGCRIKSGMTKVRNLSAIGDEDFGKHARTSQIPFGLSLSKPCLCS